MAWVSGIRLEGMDCEGNQILTLKVDPHLKTALTRTHTLTVVTVLATSLRRPPRKTVVPRLRLVPSRSVLITVASCQW